MATLKTQIQIRRDTAANLANVVLKAGEPGYATDTKKLAIGDGSTKFSSLKDYGALSTINDGILTLKASDGVTATQKTFTANDADDVTFEVKHAVPTGAAAGSYGPSAGGTQEAKKTMNIVVPYITTDKFGHITGVSNKTFTVTDTDTNT